MKSYINAKKDNQQKNNNTSKQEQTTLEAMYYFKYEHKVQMIPYIEQQISEYLKSLQRELPTMSTEKKLIVKKLLHRKAGKIQEFYYRDFSDYRASFILRSKKLIDEFFVNFAEFFPNVKPEPIRKEEPAPVLIKSPNKDSKVGEDLKKQKKQRDIQQVKVVSKVGQYLTKNLNNSNQKKPSQQKSKKMLSQAPLKKQTQNEKIQKFNTKNSPKAEVKVSVQTRQRVKTEALGSSNTWQTKKIEQSPSKVTGKVQTLRKGSQAIKKPTKQQYIKYLRSKEKQ